MTLLETFFPELYTTTTPYNLVRCSDSEMLLEFSIPGIDESNVDVEVSGNKLSVSAAANDEREYLYKGIYTKPIKHIVKLRDDVVVKGATVKNGILSISLELQIPEEKKPRKVLITH